MSAFRYQSCTVAAVALMLAGGACGCVTETGANATSWVRIETPIDGALLSEHLLRVTGTATHTETVWVDGTEVPVVDGRFSAEVPVEEGEHRIEASTPRASDAVTVRIDLTPPRVLVESPAEGALVRGRTIHLLGHVNDESAVTVTVDDVPVSVDERHAFRMTRDVEPGAHRLRVHARDAAGNDTYVHAAAVVGDFAEPDAVLENAVAAGLGRRALDEFAAGAAHFIGAADVSETIRGLNPIATGTWGELSVTDIHWDESRVTLVPRAGRIEAGIELVNLIVMFRLTGGVGGDGGLSGHMSSTVARFDVGVALGAAGGHVTAVPVSAAARLDGFSYNLLGVPGTIEVLLRDTAREMVETRLSAAIRDRVPALLERATNALPLEGHPTFAGAELALHGSVQSVEVDEDGVWVVAGLGVRALHPIEGRENLGPLMLGGMLGAPVARPDLNAAGSLDLLGATVFAMWAAGGLELRREDLGFSGVRLTVGTLGVVLPGVRALAPTDAPVIVQLSSALPPIVSQGPAGLEFNLADMHVTMTALVDGREVPLTKLSVGVHAQAHLAPREGGIGVELGELEVTADVIEGPRGLPMGPRLDALLDALFTAFAPTLLGLAVVPIPSFSGFTIAPSFLDVADGYVRFEGALTYTPAP